MVRITGGKLSERGKELLRKHRHRMPDPRVFDQFRGNEKLSVLIGMLASNLAPLLKPTDREAVFALIREGSFVQESSAPAVSTLDPESRMLAADIGKGLRLLREVDENATEAEDAVHRILTDRLPPDGGAAITEAVAAWVGWRNRLLSPLGLLMILFRLPMKLLRLLNPLRRWPRRRS